MSAETGTYMVAVRGMQAAKLTAMWGTYGKGGVEHCNGRCPEHRLTWKRLVDCDTEHLFAILRTQRQIYAPGCDYPEIILAILRDRGITAVEHEPVQASPNVADALAAAAYYLKLERALKGGDAGRLLGEG